MTDQPETLDSMELLRLLQQTNSMSDTYRVPADAYPIYVQLVEATTYQIGRMDLRVSKDGKRSLHLVVATAGVDE